LRELQADHVTSLVAVDVCTSSLLGRIEAEGGTLLRIRRLDPNISHPEEGVEPRVGRGSSQVPVNVPTPATQLCSDLRQNLGGIFASSALTYPERTALVVDGVAVSYRELATIAARIATTVRGVRPPGRARLTGILASRTVTAYAGLVGALLAGDAYVPLNPRFPANRLLAILEASQTTIVVVDARAEAVARGLAERTLRPIAFLLPDLATPPNWSVHLRRHQFICRPDLEVCGADLAVSPARPEDGAYLLFTSGSTGEPKGVLIRNRNVLAYLVAAATRYRPGPEDRFTQLFDLSFDLSVHDMFLCWGAGAALYCVPESAKLAPRELVRRNDLTFWFSVPSTASAMSRLRMLRSGDLPSLRWSLFCGEPLSRRLAEAWATAAPNSTLENLYGPTEATIAFTVYRLPILSGNWDRVPETVPIGHPFPGLRTAVVDEEGACVPQGKPGELCLGGPQVAEGYWERPDLTAALFVAPRGTEADGTPWYRTGDRVAMTQQHGLVFYGRTDTQVKIAGYRVELQEIEEVVRRAADCDCVAAVPWPRDADGLARGVVVFLTTCTVPDDAILLACRGQLPPFVVPSRLFRLTDWPLNANGKTDRRALAGMAKELDERW
jgi:amino acid adenylation domain-containing protein